MTIADGNSVYVGGLPYDANEDSIRKAFDLYGRVCAVKIVNDRGVGGKCYGFVTFTNPRSAEDAIKDMNGRTIDGRPVKVSEVKNRNGRSNLGRDSFRRDPESGAEWDRGRDRDKIHDRDRFHERPRDRSLDRNRDRNRGYNRKRERGYVRTHDVDRTRDQLLNRDKDREHGNLKDIEQEHIRNHLPERDRDPKSDWHQDREVEQTRIYNGNGEKDKDQILNYTNGSSDVNDQRSRELSSEFIGRDENQVEGELEFSTQRLEELKKEISHMEESIEEKGEFVEKLQEKSQSLEDALIMAKKLTSHHQMQLTKLHKCYQHMKECSDRVKGYEEELQALVDSTSKEIAHNDDVVLRNGPLPNGNL
ncbi:Zinc finger CCCH domain-containing protein 25 [Heracleum sosnowskyi]|uniref:Zinc finger CCCH domain-containing protein 25 n=1 Tax=Heracleum sosnowskyi TaxID=360622 RepID=A0AAD8JC81_9APIA|nr:Zinc finger CCCH domain-containing protein 25 [Heracleum sosnowskyi]